MGDGKLLFGLIGFPLCHSFSPDWFNGRFNREGKKNHEYRLFPLVAIEDFPGFLWSEPGLAGLNVTIPYKEKIIPFLDEMDETAHLIGAVNTIKISRNDGNIRTKGFNTDAQGFELTLTDTLAGCKALILGSGGASKAVAFALGKKKIKFTFVSRNRHEANMINYSKLNREIIREHLLIINTTPLGMYPEIDYFPEIPYQFLTSEHFLYDLIYNPRETAFLRKGTAMSARTMNGYQMLDNQANLAYRIFTE